MSGIVTIIQARTGSTRLPRKILLPLGDDCVLDVMLSRVKASRLAGTVIVATTTDADDDVIPSIAARNDVPCFRGDPLDLLDRHYRAAAEYGATHVVKIPSDCPLIDPAVIDHVLGVYLSRRTELDYCSNLHPASHPDGNDVEVMRFTTLYAAWREATRPFEREHTTPFIWNHPDRFRVANVLWDHPRDCSMSHRVVLDYLADYDIIRSVHSALTPGNPMFTAIDVVKYLDSHPDVMALNAAYRGVHWYRNHLDELPFLAEQHSHQRVSL